MNYWLLTYSFDAVSLCFGDVSWSCLFVCAEFKPVSWLSSCLREIDCRSGALKSSFVACIVFIISF